MAQFVAAIALCAFIIDRIIASLMFVSSWIQTSRDQTRKGQARHAEQKRQLLYFLLSGGLAAVALLLTKLKLDLSGLGNVPPLLSPILTWLILVAGAERVSSFIGVGSEAKPAPESSSETREVRVVGTLSVDPETAAGIVEGAER